MQKRIKCGRLMAFLTGFILFLTAPYGSAQAESARDAIARLNKVFEEAHLKGDIATIVSQYSKHAESYFEGEDIIKGREAIEEHWKKDIGSGGRKAKVQTLEVEEHGHWAYEAGKFLVTNSDGDIVYDGKYIIIWKREKDGWKIYREIGNSNRPK